MWVIQMSIMHIDNELRYSVEILPQEVMSFYKDLFKQGKFGGFDSCHQPSNFTQTGFKLSIFWTCLPSCLMDDLTKNRALVLCYVKHSNNFKTISELKFELQSGNA